jgi:hypothetical protein
MSLRTLALSFSLVVVAGLGCGGGGAPRSDDPTTAKEKQRREAAATGEAEPSTGKWGGWRYTGERRDCFFVVGRRCFKTEAAACAAARCGKAKCETVGGGPATVGCAK